MVPCWRRTQILFPEFSRETWLAQNLFSSPDLPDTPHVLVNLMYIFLILFILFLAIDCARVGFSRALRVNSDKVRTVLFTASGVDTSFTSDQIGDVSERSVPSFFISFFLSVWKEVVFCLSQESQLSAIISPPLFLVTGAGKKKGGGVFSGSTPSDSPHCFCC